MPTTCSKRAWQSVATTCPFSPTRSTSSWPIRSVWLSCRPTCNVSPSRMLHRQLSIGCCCSRSADGVLESARKHIFHCSDRGTDGVIAVDHHPDLVQRLDALLVRLGTGRRHDHDGRFAGPCAHEAFDLG